MEISNVDFLRRVADACAESLGNRLLSAPEFNYRMRGICGGCGQFKRIMREDPFRKFLGKIAGKLFHIYADTGVGCRYRNNELRCMGDGNIKLCS